jgi:hypothetical protein
MPDGSVRSMGSQVYKVRNVPLAQIYLGSKTGGPISKGELLAAKYITVGHGPEFPFQGLQYHVISYKLLVSGKGSKEPLFDVANSNQISGNAHDRFNNVRPGDIVAVADVLVEGPGGHRVLPGATFTVRP